jgi:CRP-like cAMP-binding protein
MLMLRGMPAFEPLGEDDLLALAEHANARRYRARDPILVEGEPIANVYVLTEGHVRIERDNQVLADLRERGHIGLISLLAGQPSPSAVALSDSLALEVPASVITVTAHERFDIARNSVRLIAAELLSRRNQLPVLPDGVVPDIGVLRPRALTLVERMFRIRQVGPFANANMDAVAELAKHSREVRFEPGTRLWGIGDAAPWALRIDYGLVDCENERGERAVVGAGFTLGALDGVAGARRSYSAVTKTLVVGLELRTAIQLAVLEVHPTLAQELRKTLAMLLVSSGGA